MFNFCEFRREDGTMCHLCDSTDTCYIGDEYHYTVESRYVKMRLLKISVKLNVKVPF